MLILSITIPAIFVVLAFFHFYWALGGGAMKDAAIPSFQGKKLFAPRPSLTAAVGVALLLCALVTTMLRNADVGGSKAPLLIWLADGLAALLFIRAVGDFRFVGFFKKVRDSRFAQLDTVLYSPLCALLAFGIYVLADNQ